MSDKAATFKKLLKQCWFSQIRDLDVGSDVQKFIQSQYGPLTEAEFKWHLADAILNKRFSIDQYERLTDFDFETREEVAEDLTQP